MHAHVAFLLFLKPEDELPDRDGQLRSGDLRRLAKELQRRLLAIATAVEKLRKQGWDHVLLPYHVECFPAEPTTPAQARATLKKLGIGNDLVTIMFYPDDEDHDVEFDMDHVQAAET